MTGVLGRLWASRRGRAGLVLVGALALAALLAPVLAPYDPIAQLDLVSKRLAPPSWGHPLGTDDLSRDLLSRMLYGARISLSIACASVLVSVTVGTGVGLVAGYAGGAVDASLMRLVDGALAVPRVFLLLVVLGLWHDVGLAALVVILGVTSWFDTSRLVRAEVLSLRNRDFMIAARALGLGPARTLLRHVLPNVAAPVIVTATLGIGQIVLVEAGLSFLGVGVRPPAPSWGVMIAEGQPLMVTAPWTAAFPGLAIALTVVGFSLVGDALRGAADPRAR